MIMGYFIHNGRSMAKSVILITVIITLNLTKLSGFPILSSSYGSGQHLADANNVSESSRRSDDTERVDPLDHFKKYTGGFDITNKHYWSSTSFTGIHGYSIAVLWLLCGVGYGIFRLATSCKRIRKLKKRSPCHKQCYLHHLLLAIFFILLVIIGCGLVLGGNAKFHSRAKKIIDIVINAANEASNTIYSTTRAMKDMDSSLREVGGNSEATEFLTSTSRQLDIRAADIARQASNNRRLIHNGVKIMFIVTTMTISLTVISATALLGFGILKFRKTLRLLIGICWIFAAFCWLFFGIYLFLQNFSGDACTALESFQQNPYNNSLSSILPCNDLLLAKSVLNDVSTGIYGLVNEVNRNISSSYGGIVHICNPFSPPPLYEYQPLNCPPTSIRIGNIPQVLRMLACPDTDGETCKGGILIPASYYNTVEAYSNSIQTLLDAYPGMDRLVQCQTVSDAFTEILQHCEPLKRNVHMVWASMVFLSVAMVALVLLWTIDAHHEQNHHSLGGSSVRPHFDAVVGLEHGNVKTTNDDLKPV